MSLLHFYRGTPLLRRLQALESIVQLIAIPNDDSKLVQHWARNVHETFNRMHHLMIVHPRDYGTLDSRQGAEAESIVADRLEELAARLSSLRPEASERFFYSGQIPPFEQLVRGLNLKESLLPTISWYEVAASTFTLNLARSRPIDGNPLTRTIEALLASMLALRLECFNRHVARNDNLHWPNSQLFAVRCDAIRDRYLGDEEWRSLTKDQRRAVYQIVRTTNMNLLPVVKCGRVPPDLLYLWVPPIETVRDEIASLVPHSPNRLPTIQKNSTGRVSRQHITEPERGESSRDGAHSGGGPRSQHDRSYGSRRGQDSSSGGQGGFERESSHSLARSSDDHLFTSRKRDLYRI